MINQLTRRFGGFFSYSRKKKKSQILAFGQYAWNQGKFGGTI